jgi:type IV pilus assembly protein PilW
MSRSTPIARHSRAPSRGFTLVELLIAISLAIFLIGGVLKIVQDTRRATTSQGQSTQLQDNVRLAMTVMTDVIETAGYYTDPQAAAPADAFPALGVFVKGQTISGTGAFGAAAPGDTVSVQYQTATGDGILNCGGTSNVTGANEFFVNAFSVDALGDLNCTLTSAAGVTVIPLIQAVPAGPNQLQVLNLQILYGVQTNLLASNGSADSYMDATQVAATFMNGITPAWNYVVSVRITLSFANPVAGLPPLQFTRIIPIMSKMGVIT